MHKKATRNHPLSPETKKRNRRRIGTRALEDQRIRHDEIPYEMGRTALCRSNACEDADMLLCLTYDMKRLAFLKQYEQNRKCTVPRRHPKARFRLKLHRKEAFLWLYVWGASIPVIALSF